MSLINKDTIIQQCADAYRTATGTTEPVKYGELGEKISHLGVPDNTIQLKELDATTHKPTVADLTNWTPCNIESISGSCIPTYMFYSTGASLYSDITDIIIPHVITGVGLYAFSGLTGWHYDSTKFDMSHLVKIMDYAFRSCCSLNWANLNLPEIKNIGSGAFSGTSPTQSGIVSGNITLGSSGNAVESIGANAFLNQSGITSIKVYVTRGTQPLAYQPWGAVNTSITYWDAETGEQIQEDVPVRSQIELNDANQDLIHIINKYLYTKTNSGWSIGGYFTVQNNKISPILISTTQEAAILNNCNVSALMTTSYNNETYYYRVEPCAEGTFTTYAGYDQSLGNFEWTAAGYEQAALALLKYYFYDES